MSVVKPKAGEMGASGGAGAGSASGGGGGGDGGGGGGKKKREIYTYEAPWMPVKPSPIYFRKPSTGVARPRGCPSVRGAALAFTQRN